MKKPEICFYLGLIIGIVLCKIRPNLLYDFNAGTWILIVIVIAVLIQELLKKKPDK